MRTIQKTSNTGIIPSEYSRIPHMVYLTDFNTNHPQPNRIDRIASEIDEYLNWKRKRVEGVKQNYTG